MPARSSKSSTPQSPIAARVAFGLRVRERRLELGMSQEAFGEAAGLHRTYIGGIERGERNLSFTNVIKVTRALEVDPGELLAGL